MKARRTIVVGAVPQVRVHRRHSGSHGLGIRAGRNEVLLMLELHIFGCSLDGLVDAAIACSSTEM
jgi:hypothetical protein